MEDLGAETGLLPGWELDPSLVSDGYRLTVRGSAAYAGDPGVRFDLSPDGTFSGHARPSWFECGGSLTEPERAHLTDLLNDAHVLSRVTNGFTCNDCSIPVFEIVAIDGPAMGRENRFVYNPPAGRIDELDEIVALTLNRVDGLEASGACTECPHAQWSPTCYPEDLGASSVCVRGERRACGSSNVDEVLRCENQFEEYQLECDDSTGWSPAFRWAAERADLWRYVDRGSTVVQIDVVLTVSNLDDASMTNLPFYWRFEDENGGEIAGPTDGGISYRPGATPGQYIASFSYLTERLSSPFETAPVLFLRLRERAWDVAAFGEPIPVTLRDGAPTL